MALTNEEIFHLAQLARLDLPEEEIEKLRQELDRILGYVDRLVTIDTSNIPEAEELVFSPSFREDVSFPCDEAVRQLILSNFPERTGDALSVPAVFEKPKG